MVASVTGSGVELLSMDGALAVVQAIWINILLSGDNAIAIGLACHNLPPRYRRLGIIYGTAAAIVLRILFAVLVAWLIRIPYLRAAGGLALLWIVMSLIRGGDADHDVKASDQLWHAVRTIVVADATMSLDNVLGIAAVSRGNTLLFVVALLLSMPLIMAGATLFTRVLDRFPIIVWAGAALLGWVAGGLITDDVALRPLFKYIPGEWLHTVAGMAGILAVVAGGWLLGRAAGRRVAD